MKIARTVLRFLFPQTKEELYFVLKEMTGSRPRNLQLYKEALAHKSVSFTDRYGRCVNNERLEFLGDAIIEAVVSNYLFRKYTNAGEGFMTKTRSKIVARESLGKLSRDIGLDKLVHREISRRSHNSYIDGNAFEALFGALYLDRGYRHCQRFFLKLVLDGKINIDELARKEINFKSELYEWAQKWHVVIELESSRVNNDPATPEYMTRVVIEDFPISTGRGWTKKESHQQAARQALRKLRTHPRLESHLLHDKYMRQVVADAFADVKPQ